MKPLLIVWFSGKKRAADEEETKAAVDLIERTAKIEVINERWDTALKRCWDWPEDIIVMEHDVVPTVNMLEKMLICPYSYCTQRYRVYPASTNLPYEVYGDRYLNSNGELTFHAADNIIPDFTKWADAASLCFTKFKLPFRKAIGSKFFSDKTLDLVNLDHKIALQAVAHKIKCHVHFPEMKHNHTTLTNEWHDVKKLYLGD